MTNVEELRAAIEESGISVTFIADKLGISREGLYKKMSNRTEFKASEIVMMTEILHLTARQREAIFFAK